MYILGISAYFHDSAAALLLDGRVLAAAQEERFTRIKHDSAFPVKAIHQCLAIANIGMDEIEYIIFYEKPFWKFERILDSIVSTVPFSFRQFHLAMPLWFSKRLWIKSEIQKKLDFKKTILFADHHSSHAASAFYTSNFEEAAVLIIDGVGEESTTSIGQCKKNKITLLKQHKFPHSLGMLYSAFTQYCGFKVNSGEYKLMGIAPLGNPKFKSLIYDHLITVFDDGSYYLHMQYFDFTEGLQMINTLFFNLFGKEARIPESPLTPFYADIAASIQEVLEEIALKLVLQAKKITQLDKIVFAGGSFLNCKMNQRIAEAKIFDDHYFYFNPGDAGAALGAAYLAHFDYLKHTNLLNQNQSPYLGSTLFLNLSERSLEEKLNQYKLYYIAINDNLSLIANLLMEGQIVATANGPMEYGPRALGNRSILADPRSAKMKDILNERVKYRENFRPFAPILLENQALKFFDLKKTKYDTMMVTASALPEAFNIMPAVIHTDGTARIQLISPEKNAFLHSLLSEFYSLTGCPALINTSFNIRGEPIVANLEDALHTFLYTDIDALILENKYLILKKGNLDKARSLIPQKAFQND